jgi:hypothetical protein
MGLDDIVRAGVRTIHGITRDLQAPVTIQPWIGQDVHGEAKYDLPGTLYTAIVDTREQQKKDILGNMVSIRALVIILVPVPPHGAPGRREPIDPRDKVILPDGSSGTIVGIAGFIDGGTSKPYFHEIWIGIGGRGERA